MRWFAPLILIVLTAAARAETGNDRVRCDVYADRSAVVAGQPFDVAVHFHIDPGWHIYWTNPGDSGLPTTVKLTLPPGFTAGPVRYPVPSVLPQTGGAVNYGYEKDATLIVRATPPATLPAASVKLSVVADWLVCQERCLIGHAELPLELPTAAAAEPAHVAAFTVARDRLVRYVDPEHVRALQTTVNGTRFTVAVSWSYKPTGVAWVPAAVSGAEVTDVTTTPTGIAFTVAPLMPGRQPAVVAGVLTYIDGGQRFGVAAVLRSVLSTPAAK